MTLSPKLIAAFCLLQTAFTLVLCAPPISELAEVAEGALRDYAVSTELTLGVGTRRPLERVPTNSDNWLSLWPQHRDPLDEASPSDPSAVSSGAPSLDHPYSTLEGSTSDPQHDLPPPAFPDQLARSARVPLTPGLDRSIGHSQYGPGPDDYRLSFPTNAQYVASPWFERFWTDAAVQLRYGRYHARTAVTQMRVPMTPAVIREMVDDPRRYLHSGRMYKLTLPQPFAPYVEPGEVLVRYHTRISFPGQPRFREKMSVWSTTGQGRSLAFLGLFHCPVRFFDLFMQSARAQVFEYQDFDGASFYLTPSTRS